MKFRSDLIIYDCKIAIAKHTPLLQGVDFRLSWWMIISLLRAVGHVLHNSDSKISTIHKSIIESEFKKLQATKPKPEIYWEFVQLERNKFLKEYDYGVRRVLTHATGEGAAKTSVSLIVETMRQLNSI